MLSSNLFLLFLSAAFPFEGVKGSIEYYGKYLGPLSRLNHGVSGEVYAVDARTLHIKDFTYDGEGPAAYFWAGNTKAPGPAGFRIRDENGSSGVLKRYNRKHITITLPEGKTLNSIRWFSVWCEEFAVNFGDVAIPRGLDFPKPQKIGALSGVHGVSSDNIVIVDAQTLLIPSFSYDGEAPDAKFWVGRGSKPSPQGIRVPDENGGITPLRRYDRKTIVLTLPNDLTVFDIGHFGVWCEAFTVDFGHVQVPPGLNVPPSLKMLGVSPQSKLNCEVLSDDLAYEVRWAVAGDSIVIQLVAKLEGEEYMSFGLSGDSERSIMIGGDVVVAWVDQTTLNGFAQDYFLDAKAQCAGNRGTCPDYRIQQNTESVRLLNAALVNGYSIVTFQRPLGAHDVLDRQIFTNRSQPVIWAVGPLNSKSEASYHSITSKGDLFLDFGRPPKWNCPIPESDTAASSSANSEDSVHHTSSSSNQKHTSRGTEAPTLYKTPPPPAPASTRDAWEIPPIQCNEPDDGVFYAQMGPTGGKRGYSAITGHVGWGISYYINGLLIPEINVVRGKTYTFVVEGGKDADVPAKFHPFYITDDPIGGYQHKTPEEKRKVRIFAGAELNKLGEVVPTGLGRLCSWTPDPDQPLADEFVSFGAYQRTLTLICDTGEPGVVQWTPDNDTPDTVYYQCFAHRYLGWKINVLDSCNLPNVAASEPVPNKVLPSKNDQDELVPWPSIQVATRVKPDFYPQSLFSRGKPKIPQKNKFPYEIVKPTPETLTKENSTDKHVIPVTEIIEDDTPEITTIRVTMSVENRTGEATAVPISNRPTKISPVRNGYNGRPPVPNRRPVMVMRHRPQHVLMMPPAPIPFSSQSQRPIAPSSTQNRPVIIKKPIMRLPQRPMMMHSALPPHPPMLSQPAPVSPNRILPKPVYVQKFKKPLPPMAVTFDNLDKTKLKIQPSQMLSQTSQEMTPRLPLAVNTGFNPGSLVIEGGFKPIIQNQSVAQDRILEMIDYEENNEGVINMDDLDEQKSQTEMFEPMFIPSPLDSNAKHSKKPTTEPVKKMFRKPIRQIIIRRPIYSDDEALFRSGGSELLGDEIAMADEKTFYLTPKEKRISQVLTYDGQKVPGSHIPPVPNQPELKSRGSAVLKKSPQFGPFKGEIPPPIPSQVKSDIPQLGLRGKKTSIIPGTLALPLKQINDNEGTVSERKTLTTQPPHDLGSKSDQPLEREKRATEQKTQGHTDHDHSQHVHSKHDHSNHQNYNETSQKQTSRAPYVVPFTVLSILSAFTSYVL